MFIIYYLEIKLEIFLENISVIRKKVAGELPNVVVKKSGDYLQQMIFLDIVAVSCDVPLRIVYPALNYIANDCLRCQCATT